VTENETEKSYFRSIPHCMKIIPERHRQRDDLLWHNRALPSIARWTVADIGLYEQGKIFLCCCETTDDGGAFGIFSTSNLETVFNRGFVCLLFLNRCVFVDFFHAILCTFFMRFRNISKCVFVVI